MGDVWRLLLDPPGGGVWNMAVDEALLASAQSGGVATLRLYAWRGPWLSLGYAQTLSAARAEACGRMGIGVVRRVTGGRAVLHGADLTYAVAAPEARLPAGLQASYALVARALVRALSQLGVAADVAAGASPPVEGAPFDCFARAATDEICVHGRKLAGSAQRRAGGGVLQHGSLRLSSDPPAIARAAGSVPGTATSLAELGLGISFARAQAAIVRAFQEETDIALEAGALSETEEALALGRAGTHREKPWAPPGPIEARSSRPLTASR